MKIVIDQRIKIPSETERAWMAGFIDGEGSIGISKQPRVARPTYSYRANIQVCNTNRPALDIFVEFYNGGVYPVHDYRRKSIARWKPGYSWRCPISSSLPLLTDLLFFLRIKNEQAKTVIDFLKEKRESRLPRLPTGRWGGTTPLTPIEIEWRESLYQKMKALNRRGIAQGL